MKHARISGYLLLLTGLLHTLISLVEGYPQLLAMAQDGFINTVTLSPEREAIFWLLVCGIALFLAGLLALGYDRSLPASFGWGLLLLSLTGALILGPSGFYLVTPQAIYILVVAYCGTQKRGVA
jgi:low temperature requirement protein LtrA